MSGGSSSNKGALAFEKQQAAEAKAKEALRQSRLDQGTKAINAIYDGTPVTQNVSTPFDWTNMKAPTPDFSQGFTILPAGSALPSTPAANNGTALSDGLSWSQNPSGAWGIKDAAGNWHARGSAFNYDKATPTGQTTGGFGDDFFNNYRQSYEDLNNPEEQRQYDQARTSLTYNLARSGLLNSSLAATKTGELAYQDALQKAKIVSDADSQTAQFRQNVLSQKQAAINQLYATEDPSLAANLAQNSAKGLQLQQPQLTPGASLFAPALSAVGSYIAGQTSPYGNYYQQQGGGTSVAPANQSSGKAYS